MYDVLPLFNPSYAVLQGLVDQLGVAAVLNMVTDICSRKKDPRQSPVEDEAAERAWSRPVRRRIRRARAARQMPVRAAHWQATRSPGE